MNALKNFKSQYRQDQLVDILLNQKANGFFLDIGAYDGLTFSNSYFFEKERGWKGICVEPIPSVFKSLQQNRSCTLVNGAISETEEELSFTHVTGYSEMLSGIKKYRSSDHIARTNREILENGGTIENITCKGYNSNNLLDRYGIDKVDYLSIDIEGGELEVLKSINFSKIDIDLITVENNYNDEEIKHFLKQKGFFYLFKYQSDDFFSSKKIRGFRLLRKEKQLGRAFLLNYLNSFKISKGLIKIIKNYYS